MEQHEATAFIERWQALYNADKRAFIDEMYDDDVEIYVPGMFTLRGRDQVWDALGVLYQGPVTLQITAIHRVVAAGNTIVVEFDTQIGEELHHALSLIDLRDGRVLSDHSYAAVAGKVPGLG